MKKCDLMIKGRYILPLTDNLEIIEKGFVIVNGNLIEALGTEKELAGIWSAEKIIDAGESVVMPGFINTHTHAAMAYFRGLADDLPLFDWLEKHIWPAEKKLVNPDFIRKSAELACLEMIKAGVTCFNDMYFFSEITAEIAKRAGLRLTAGEVILDFPTPSASSWKEAVKKSEQAREQFKTSELVSVSLAPHSVYACGREILLKVKESAADFSLIHIHLSETKKEVEDCFKRNGCSPVSYLNKLGFLGENVLAAHSVWLDENDLEIYRTKGVKMSHNPSSNMKLASGIAPLPRILAKNICASLGTDGAASNNTLDLFSEMKICALLHKASNSEPTAVKAEEVLKMATGNGARALGLEEKIGSLSAGRRADIITVSLNKPHLTPLYNPYSHLVYCANAADVENVIVNGRLIMKNREVLTLDEEKILRDGCKIIL